MPQFPELGRTYEPVQANGFDLFGCVNCGNTRRDEACIRKVQNTCADNNWSQGWCRLQRDMSEKAEQGEQHGE